MNEDELRTLIRAAVQRHLGTASPESAFAPEHSGELRRDAAFGRVPEGPDSISFSQYQIERADTMCIIEPAVHCNHCGFCKCHGH